MKKKGKVRRKKALVKASKKIVKPKKAVKITVFSKVLGKAPEKHSFVLHDGRKLRTVYELIDELETMNNDVFKNYVNESKHDFANWLGDVFEAKALSEEIRKTQNKLDNQRAIMKHLIRELRKISRK